MIQLYHKIEFHVVAERRRLCPCHDRLSFCMRWPQPLRDRRAGPNHLNIRIVLDTPFLDISATRDNALGTLTSADQTILHRWIMKICIVDIQHMAVTLRQSGVIQFMATLLKN
ncbi:hypothetical protein DYI26_23140 [Halomonas litopenaei]|nr:hypothetical protein [Halomonas litopenaei]